MRSLVPLTNASFVFKFLISKTMQLIFNTDLCGGKPLIVKEFCVLLLEWILLRGVKRFFL
jgi:hypothetical protein